MLHVVRRCDPCRKIFPHDRYMEYLYMLACCYHVDSLIPGCRANLLISCWLATDIPFHYHLTSIMLAHCHAILELIILMSYYHVIVEAGLCCQWLSVEHVFKVYPGIRVTYSFRQTLLDKSTGTILLNEHFVGVNGYVS